MKTSSSICAALAAVAVQAIVPGFSQPPSDRPYHVSQTYKLGVSGGYDYMTFDTASRRIYIAQGSQMVVFDTSKGAVTGTLSGLNHAHGVAFDPDGTNAYLSDGGAGTVVIFDRSTLAKLGEIAAGSNPDGMIVEPTTHHLFVFNGKSKNLTIMDPASRTVIATVPLPGKPEFPTADGKGNVFVNIEDTHQVVKISAASNKALATWALAGCESPTGMAIDPGAGRIFPVCDNAKMPVVDIDTGKVVAMPAIGKGPDAAVYDAAHHLLFSSNGDAGTLSIVKQDSPDKYTLIQTVKTLAKARTLALDPTSGDVYVIAPAAGSTAAAPPLVLMKISR